MEDSIYTIIGLVMMYTWVHSMVIIFPKLKEVTGYEKTVLIVALVGFVFFVLGSI